MKRRIWTMQRERLRSDSIIFFECAWLKRSQVVFDASSLAICQRRHSTVSALQCLQRCTNLRVWRGLSNNYQGKTSLATVVSILLRGKHCAARTEHSLVMLHSILGRHKYCLLALAGFHIRVESSELTMVSWVNRVIWR